VPLADFVVGSRKVAREPGELVTAILVPRRANGRSSFIKAGHRRYLVISIAMVAVVLDVDDNGVITYARVAVGACSAVAAPLAPLESLLVGRKPAGGLLDSISEEHLTALSPIDDVRGSAGYRLDAVRTLVKRAYEEAADEYAH
jgi:CO/xanthine dehydrogenase FAD-binding subunit